MKVLLQLYFIAINFKVLLQQSLNCGTLLCCDNRYLITIQFKVLQLLLHYSTVQSVTTVTSITINFSVLLQTFLNYYTI